MKKLSLLLFVLSTFILFECNQTEPDRLAELQEFPEVLMVKRSSFNNSYNDLTAFAQGLTVKQRTLLEEYVDKERANAKTNTEAPTCNCTPGQGSCSAEGFFNSCCICCPAGRAFVCGVTVGVASCKCEDAPPPAKKGANQEEDEIMIQVKPRGINEMFDFAAQNGINVANIKKSLTELVKSTS